MLVRIFLTTYEQSCVWETLVTEKCVCGGELGGLGVAGELGKHSHCLSQSGSGICSQQSFFQNECVLIILVLRDSPQAAV